MEVAATADFRADTAVEQLGEGRWGATIRESWSGPPGPNGGYVAALLLRAIAAEVADPAREPRSLTIHYLRPPQDGPVQIAVTVERAGTSGGGVDSSAAASKSGESTQMAMQVTLPCCCMRAVQVEAERPARSTVTAISTGPSCARRRTCLLYTSPSPRDS